MRASAEKSATTSATASQVAREPFVTRSGDGNFIAPSRQTTASSAQPKMAVSTPGDKFEQEADQMAAKVMRMPAPPAAAGEEKLQRRSEDKLQKREEEKILRAVLPDDKLQKKEDEKLQKSPADEPTVRKREEEKILRTASRDDQIHREAPAGGAPAIGGDTQSAIQNKMAGGEPLSADVRGYMEPRFGADFSTVRIHKDPEAASLNNQLGAKAFANRNHVFFSRDQYQPGTSGGKELLAHELAHTIQQGHSVQRKADAPVAAQPGHATPAVQHGAASAHAATSSEVVNIATNTFNPSQKVKDEIIASGSHGLDVRVIVKGLTAEGSVKIRADSAQNYLSIGQGTMPLLNAWTKQLGGMHLNFSVANSEIKRGFASLKPGGGNAVDWVSALQRNSSALGGLGLKVDNLPTPVNKFDNGQFVLGVTGLNVEVGGFLEAKFDVSVENMSTPKIGATAHIDIKGIIGGDLKLDNASGPLTGQVSLAIKYQAFSGTANIKFGADGNIDVGGKAAYSHDRLSGEIEFVATDLESADRFAQDAIAAAGGLNNVQEAGPPAAVPQPKPGQKKRALAATGSLAFNLTKWFAGTAHVVVDGEGAITVIGKLAPPAEIELFKQKDWTKNIIDFEAKAYYGIPVVGNLNLFAKISLDAIARLGPAKICNIEILGTYSTNPKVQKNIEISGTINISAYGGLKLGAEGGAAVEIVSHDLKFGVGLHADVGVQAYADARPTIGYRDPGEFHISGTLEMIAQPTLGLGGEFFIALVTPWWSPLSDHRWSWELFSKEWPLTEPIGISASIKDYVLGSGAVPEIELKKPTFDPSKFMTSMVDKTLPDKSGGPGAAQGTFKDDGTITKSPIPPKKSPPKAEGTKSSKKNAALKGGKSGAPDQKAANDQKSTKIFESAAKPLAELKSKGALMRSALNKELAKIRAQAHGIDFSVELRGDKWIVTPKANGKIGRPVVQVGAKDLGPKDKDGKEATSKEGTWNAAAAGVKADLAQLEKNGVTGKDLEHALPGLKHKYEFASLHIESTKQGWRLRGSMSPERVIDDVPYLGSQADPFDLDWPKPASRGYPTLYFGGPTEQAKRQSEMSAMVGRPFEGAIVRSFAPTSPTTLAGGEQIGLTSDLDVGTVIGPLTSASTPGGGRINRIFKKYGFRAGAEGLDGDHVQEIQFGGHDAIENLWPLNSSINRGAGSKLAQAKVFHPKASSPFKIADLKSDTAHKYYFRIKSTSPAR